MGALRAVLQQGPGSGMVAGGGVVAVPLLNSTWALGEFFASWHVFLQEQKHPRFLELSIFRIENAQRYGGSIGMSSK